MKLLIDGDIIAYKAAAAAEKPINWGDGLWTLHAWEEDVKQIIDEFIQTLFNQAEFDGYEVALSSHLNFRKEINFSYKANRSGTRKPMLLGFARDYIMGNHEGTIYHNLEADDVLGILGSDEDKDYVIWSLDKDLMTVPGDHLIGEDIIHITEFEADYTFFTQVLTGDSTDNYGGCPTIGPVSAEKILKKADKDGVPIWDAIVAAYEKHGHNEEYALLQARMAYILRKDSYNEITGEVKLWTPETMLR